MNASAPIADLGPLNRAREQRAWYFTDWAASAFQTTVAGVLFAPYLISVAENAVGEHGRLHVLGLSIAPGSLPSYVITFSTLLSALIFPIVGALADRTARKPDLLVGFSWLGAVAAGLLFFMSGENWLFGSIAFMVANLAGGAAIVVSDSILPLISTEDERDRTSSVGWAYGYAGGGLLLAVNFAVVTFHDALGLDKELAVRLSLLSAAVWWAGFMVIPWRGIRRHQPVAVEQVAGGLFSRSFGQLGATLKDLRNYPVAMTFLVAYLFFNDGIQTVIASASTFGIEELDFEEGAVLGIYLLVQFVAMFGAIGFGRAAGRFGAKKVILAGIVGWMGIVTVALVVPAGQLIPFLVLGVAIGVVLGGTQALARSYFSLFIPRGKEAEYFSLYHAMDRGTSWFGTLTFGIVYQLTDSYRPAIFALVAFFVLGGLLLLRVDTARGIREAGNVQPAVI
ncbi:MFS transporter [Nocardioides daeguensis]|uniref:MFS transporter n=1 Tax=Nocardioides daeguensis TaxID=908359 RepID=A0ABP6W487_9ACTN|nr:MFS transporter [Nocardioides daeguensis]MBV6726597.1 MFS transporter [Nocardioides daeguensis]MCR1774651.1 MFS transporter [Nocardioides daeguensis]